MKKMNFNKSEQNRSLPSVAAGFNWTAFAGVVGVVGIGYALYRYRFKIQELLAEQGIDTPWLKGSADEAVRSGASKISGSLKHDANHASAM